MLQTCCLILLTCGLMGIVAGDVDCTKPPKINIQTCCADPEFQSKDELNDKCMIYTLNIPYGQELAGLTCFTECFLNKTKFLVNGNIDNNQMQKFMKNELSNDPEYIDVMINSMKTCIPIAKKSVEDAGNFETSIPPLNCNPFARFLIACTQKENFINCPAEVWNPSSSSDCDAAKEYFQNCT